MYQQAVDEPTNQQVMPISPYAMGRRQIPTVPGSVTPGFQQDVVLQQPSLPPTQLGPPIVGSRCTPCTSVIWFCQNQSENNLCRAPTWDYPRDTANSTAGDRAPESAIDPFAPGYGHTQRRQPVVHLRKFSSGPRGRLGIMPLKRTMLSSSLIKPPAAHLASSGTLPHLGCADRPSCVNAIVGRFRSNSRITNVHTMTLTGDITHSGKGVINLGHTLSFRDVSTLVSESQILETTNWSSTLDKEYHTGFGYKLLTVSPTRLGMSATVTTPTKLPTRRRIAPPQG